MQEPISIPPFLVDLANSVIFRHGREIRLRRKTFSLLRYLLEHRDRLLTKDELLDEVWQDAHVGDAVLKVTISQLRKTFRESRSLEIATMHGRGYCVRLGNTANGKAGTVAGDAPPEQHRALTGRTNQLDALHAAFEKARTGERQIVFLGGEAGIGKSALVEAFVRRVEDLHDPDSRPRVGRCNCLPVAGTAEPLRPVFAALAGIQRTRPNESLSALLARFAPHLLDEAETMQPEPPPLAQESVLESVAREIDALSAAHVVVLVVEDLHWSDAQTCALLAALLERPGASRLLVLATYRPAEVVSRNRPVSTILRELSLAHPLRTRVLRLEALGPADIAQMVTNDLGGAHPALARFLFERSGGNPLFVDRLLVHLQASGALHRRDGDWHFDEASVRRGGIPRELDHFIAAQLDQLEHDGRKVLQAASVAGTTFMAQDVAAVLGSTVEHVEAVCDELANRHQLLDMSGVKSRADGVVGTEYQFRHPLLQNVLYDRLPATCRRDFHARLAAQLETSYGEFAVLNAHELAHHFERSGNPDRTLHYLRVAAHVAVQRGMLGDAREYLKEVTRTLETNRDASGRLDAATELARLLVIYSGPNAETSAAVGRALELQASGAGAAAYAPADEQPTFLLLAMHVVEGNFLEACDVAERLLALRPDDVAPEVRVALGLAHYGLHRPAAAIAELQRALEADRPVHGLTVDHTMIAHAILALSSLQTGRLSKVRGHYDAALRHARSSEAPVNHTVGLGFLTELHLLCGEWEWAAHLAIETESVSVRHDLRSFVGQARFVKGLAAFQSGRYADGLEQMAASLHSCRTTAHGLGLPYLLALYGNAQAESGAPEDGLRSVQEGLDLAARTGETRCEPEIHRLEAAVLRRGGAPQQQIRIALSAALESARSRGSHLFHLRAAIDLAALLRDVDRPAARATLRRALEEIEPGVDARELRAACDLLQRLG